MYIVINFYYNYLKFIFCYIVVDFYVCFSYNDILGFIKYLYKLLLDIEYLIIISDYSIFYVMGVLFYLNIRSIVFFVSI